MTLNALKILLLLIKFTTSAEDKAEGIYRRMNLHSLIQIVPQVWKLTSPLTKQINWKKITLFSQSQPPPVVVTICWQRIELCYFRILSKDIVDLKLHTSPLNTNKKHNYMNSLIKKICHFLNFWLSVIFYRMTWWLLMRIARLPAQRVGLQLAIG